MTDLARWKDGAMREVRSQLARDPFWRKDRGGVVHLAVFVEPWLSWLIDGTKTIESRWSMRRGLPYGRVCENDTLLLKASSGPVVGICAVAKPWYFDLSEVPLKDVRRRFGKAIAGDAELWESVQDARYVTLLEVREPRALSPIACPKKDRRGWVTFAEG